MLLMIFASHHLSARHALSLRLWSWLELIDLALPLPPASLPPAEQPDGEKQDALATTGYLQRSSENPRAGRCHQDDLSAQMRKLRPSKRLCLAQGRAATWVQSPDSGSWFSVHPFPALPLPPRVCPEEEGVWSKGMHSDELCRASRQWGVVGRW